MSLLALSFVFGLALFGGALAVGLQAYLSASVAQTRTIRTRIALESAAASVLGELAAGSPVEAEAVTTFDGGRQQVSITRPGAKVDLASDPSDVVAQTATAVGLTLDLGLAAEAHGLAEVSARQRLSAAQEDCLRKIFTYGRGGAPRIDPAGVGDVAVGAGDQVDVRVEAVGSSGAVLWLRARFTGSATGWRIHDYRRLNGTSRCR